MMKLILLLLTLAVFWIVCEDDKDDIDDKYGKIKTLQI